MNKKSYSIATPSFNNSEKTHQLRAILTEHQTKVYSLTLNVVSPFVDNPKDYPMKVSPSVRLKGIVDDEVHKVASRIKTVESVLSKYYLGSGVKERGAVVQYSHLEEFQGYIEHVAEVLNSQGFNYSYNKKVDLIDNSAFDRIVPEYSLSILEDDAALKILRVLNGTQYIENLKSIQRKKAYESSVLASTEEFSLIKLIYDANMDASVAFNSPGRITYLPELIQASRILESPEVSLIDYDLADFLFLPFESRLIDIEFHRRIEKEHHFATVFNDYDVALKPTVHESNMRHDYFELADRVKLVRDVLFYETEAGIRTKSLYGIHDIQLLPDYDYAIHNMTRYGIFDDGYDYANHNMTRVSIYDEGYDYASHNMTRESKFDDGYDYFNHNMYRDSTDGDGYDYFNHNMTRDSSSDDGFELVRHNMTRESSSDDGFDIFYRMKEVEGKFEEYTDANMPQIHVYLPEIDWFERRQDKVAIYTGHSTEVSRQDLFESTLSEQFSYFSRIDKEGIGELLQDSRRVDEILSILDAHTESRRVDEILTSVDYVTDVSRVDTWGTNDSYLQETQRVDVIETDLATDDLFHRVQWRDVYLDNITESNEKENEVFVSLISEDYLGTKDSTYDIRVVLFQDFIYDSSGKDIRIDEFQNFNLTEVIWDGGQYVESIETDSTGTDVYISEFDMFDRTDYEFSTSQIVFEKMSSSTVYFDSTSIEIDLSSKVVKEFYTNLSSYRLFDRVLREVDTQLVTYDLFERLDVFQTLIYEMDYSIRRDIFDAGVLQFNDFSIDRVFDSLVNSIDTSHIERIWSTDVVTDVLLAKIEGEYITYIQELLDFRRQNEYLMDVIEDVSSSTIAKKAEIIEYFEFERDMVYDMDITDEAPVDRIEPEPVEYETLIVELDDALRLSIWNTFLDEIVDSTSEIREVYLPEFDLGLRIDEWSSEIIEEQITSRVDTFISGLEWYEDFIRLDSRITDLVIFEDFTRRDSFETMLSQQDVSWRNDTFDMDINIFQLSLRDILMEGKIESHQFAYADDVVDALIHYEQWAHFDPTYTSLLITEQPSDIVNDPYETEIITSEDFTKFIDYVADIQLLEDFLMVQDNLAEIIEFQDFLLDNTYDVYDSEFDDFESIILEASVDEGFHLFDRTVVEADVEDNLHWFTRILRDIQIDSNIDWFNRTIVSAIIEDIDWYTRTEVDVKLVETDVFAKEDIIYDASMEEFDDFIGPDYKDYTWLWHSRPYWWLKWNWTKTK